MKKAKIIKWIAGIYGIVTGISAWSLFLCTVKRKEKKDWENQTAEPGSYLELIQQKSSWIKKQKIEHVSIPAFDGLKLHGIFIPSEKKSDRVILAVHGFRAEGMKDFSAITCFYHEQGYHVLMVDDRAHGMSEGKYIGFGCLDREDCYRWIHYLDEKLKGRCSIFLHGISMGAATALMTSSMNLPSSVKGMIADCPYTSIWEEFIYLAKREKKPLIFMYPVLKLESKICKVMAGYEFDDCSAAEEVKDTKLPVLLIHGKEDRFVPCEMSKKIYDNCAAYRELWLVEHARHAESYHIAREEYERRVLTFMEKCDTK